MPCPFRVALIIVSAVIALVAAILALHSSTEIDHEGNERPTRSVKERMNEFYDESVRPWIPEWMGGYKRIDITDEEEEEEEGEGATHTKAQ